jgi:transposase InsO family protein/transposase
MKLHANALLGPKGREVMVLRVLEQGWPITQAAEAAGVSGRTCSKWIARYRAEGVVGLVDRSSAPGRIPHRTPQERVQLIAALRRLRMTGAEIALCTGMALSTVSAVLNRIGLGKLSRLDPPEPPNRYERARPGELLHIDVKKLGRIHAGAGHRVTGKRRRHTRDKADAAGVLRRQTGWEYVHVCVDDATRLAYVEVLQDETARTVAAFLRRAVRFYQRHGITTERVMTDNGPGYRSTLHAVICRTLGIRHLRTRPYRPRTNGKAERFIRTLLRGWAYGAIYSSSRQRTAALDGWLHTYNHRRPHGALSHKSPIARLSEQNNLTGSYN